MNEREVIIRLPKMTDARQIADILMDGVNGKNQTLVQAAYRRLREVDRTAAQAFEQVMRVRGITLPPLTAHETVSSTQSSSKAAQIGDFLKKVRADSYNGVMAISTESKGVVETIQSLSEDEITQASGILQEVQSELESVKTHAERRMRDFNAGEQGPDALALMLFKTEFARLEKAVTVALSKAPRVVSAPRQNAAEESAVSSPVRCPGQKEPANPDHVNALREYSDRLKAELSGQGITSANMAAVLTRLAISFNDTRWDSWRKKNPGPLILAGADISKMIIVGVDFVDADLTGANCDQTWFVNCHFRNANLTRASFRNGMILNATTGIHDGAICQEANFTGATFQGMRLEMQNVNFSRADFSGATISRMFVDEKTVFTGARFTGCDLKADNSQWAAKFFARLTPEQKNAVQIGGKKGCFIATACYGDYEHPSVQEFRWFRDARMNQCALGRWFIDVYYQCSPPVAALLKRSPAMAAVIRRCLLAPILQVLRLVHDRKRA